MHCAPVRFAKCVRSRPWRHGAWRRRSVHYLKRPLGWRTLRPYVPGKTLGELAPSLDPEARRRHWERLHARVLEVHRRGWAHRDLTPSNILFSGNDLTLLDWDLAQELLKQSTTSYHPRGTPGFSLTVEELDLVEQDLRSLQLIAKFLELNPPREKGKKWWESVFSARH